MKEVMSIIRMNKVNKTKKALALKGFNSLTCRKVKGRGKKKVNYNLLEQLIADEDTKQEVATSDKIDPAVAESVSEGHRLISKRLITLIVDDEEVKEVVETIIDVNQTGNPGDGKIFIRSIDNALRVRTGEQGADAI